MKLQEMIDNGEIKADEAVIGYVGAYTFAEVISGYGIFSSVHRAFARPRP